jgi:hypothetical protein
LNTSSRRDTPGVLLKGVSEKEFEDAKGVIRICKSKKDRQRQKEKGQNDKQIPTKHTYKTEDRVTEFDVYVL